MAHTDSLFNKRMKRYTWILGFAALALSIVFAVYSFQYVTSEKQKSYNDAIQELYDLCASQRNTTATQITGDMQTLAAVAQTTSASEVTEDQLLQILNEINQKNTFSIMGYGNTSGVTTVFEQNGTRHDGIDLSRATFFKKALRGDVTIEKKLSTSYNGKEIIRYAIPFRTGKRITGVIVAASPAEQFRNITNRDVFGNGYSNIIYSDGSVIICSDSKSVNTEAKSIADFGTFEAETLTKIHNDLENGRSGQYEFINTDGKKMIGVYEPVGIAGWFVQCAISQDYAVRNFYSAIRRFLVLLWVALTAFIFLLVTFFVMTKKSQRMMHIQTERYRIIEEISDEILFKYNLKDDVFLYSYKGRNNTVARNEITDFLKDKKYRQTIHADSIEIFESNFYEACCKKNKRRI